MYKVILKYIIVLESDLGFFSGWAEDMDSAKTTSLTIMGSRAGMTEDQIADCLHAMQTSEVKDELKKMTNEAISEGAYGLPYIVTRHRKGDEGYFGCDRFEVMSMRLGLDWKGPFPPTMEEETGQLSMPPPPNSIEMALEEELQTVEAIKFDAKVDLESIFKGVPLKDDPFEKDEESTKK